MSIYKYDRELPRLPLPPLDETVKELKKRVHPIANEAEYEKFCSELEAFAAADGAGALLQDKLLSWSASLQGSSSWLRPFWDDNYTSYRESLPRNMHYTLQLLSKKWGAHALSRLTCALASCFRDIREESLPPEEAKGHLSMDTVGRMLYTRIPNETNDTLCPVNLTEPMSAAVVCRGHWFIVQLTDSEGNVLSPDALDDAYDSIRKAASELPDEIAVSSYTGLDRPEAARLRAEISKYMLNRLSLGSIERAALVVCLDGECASETQFGHEVLAGDAANRFFDKSIQLISSGEHLGVSLEHSGCDGMMWSYVLGLAGQRLLQNAESGASDEPAHIRRLEWFAPESLAAKLGKIQLEHEKWGKSLLSDQKRLAGLNKAVFKQLKCSPDATVQLLFQMAYYRLTKEFTSIYEAVSMREYYQGRTECMRGCTDASAEFIRLLDSGETDNALLREKFLACASAHVSGITRAKEGFGCERHMSGLLAMHQMYFPENPLPAIFETAAYRRLKHDTLSTSSIVGPAVDYFAFVPVVTDGMGIGYALYDDGLHVAVAAYSGYVSPSDFIKALESEGEKLLKALIEIYPPQIF